VRPGLTADGSSTRRSIDQVIEDILAASAAGADEVIIDLILQPRFTGVGQVLETAQEIQERVKVAGA
jgi:hypothetical protein